MPSIHDHKHGKLMKLQSVQGNNVVMREKNLHLRQDPDSIFLEPVNISFPSAGRHPFVDMPSRCLWKKVKETDTNN